MGRLTTHVLDTALGQPAQGLRIDLFRFEMDDRVLLKSAVTNADGRCDSPLLSDDGFRAGYYELLFHAGGYLMLSGAKLPDPPFLDLIPIRFGISNADAHYHVPLLLSPFGYSTYRGS